ncbi:Cell surface glycoprotein [ANME-1 cluster archaeon GoMg1]|nr:Cell surface glycoprotein [ANME-1 cluster archaeon GoMg1]
MYMKKVIGVAAVIMVIMAIVLIAFSSMVSAYAVERTFDEEGGEMTYNGTCPTKVDKDPIKISAYEGEKIKFANETNVSVAVTVSGPYRRDGDCVSGCADYFVRAGESWNSGSMKTGYFFKVCDAEGDGCWFSVDKQSFRLKLVDDIDKVREKESFDLTLKTNNKKGGFMKLTIEDNEGYSIMNANGIDIYEVLVNYTQREFTSDPVDAEGNPVDGIKHDAEGKLVFNTAQLDMRKGRYEIILEDYATEVEKTVDIRVEKWYLEMECSEEVVKGWEDIVITIHSSFYEKEVNITVEGILGWEEKTLTLDDEGKKRVRIPTKNVDYGRYKVTVKLSEFPACAETRYVLIKKGKTSLEVPETATVGDIVYIDGTSDYGYLAVFVIDEVYKSDAAIVDDKFEWYWETSGELEGGREIEVFILNDRPSKISIGDYVSKDWQREEGVDATASISLFPPMLRMTVPKRIAESDDVVISGEATGTDRVYIIAINKEGDVVFPPDGIARATPVEEEEWEENIGELDSGNYTVISLHKGKDGRTNAIENGKWAAGGENKTLEERVAILMDAIQSAGRDDLFVLFNFTIEASYVSFNPIENITIGGPLEITGKTNREPGTKIGIWTVEGPAMLPPVITEVEWPTADQGMFTATIDTYDAVPGIYTLKAEDGDLNTDTATVEIRVPPPLAPEISISTDKKEYSPSDVIKTTIRLSNPTGSTQNMLFKWYFIRDHNNGTKIEQKAINLPANDDQTSTTSIPVDEWGNESFCGCYIVSLTNTTTNNVVSVDSASWIYLPSAECKSKTSAEIAKEIEGVELQS